MSSLSSWGYIYIVNCYDTADISCHSVIRRFTNARWSTALVGVVETIIGGGVLWGVVVTIGVWGTVRYGGVILVSAHVAYLVAVLITLYGCVRAPSHHPLYARRP